MTLSIIIPTLNEAERVGALIKTLKTYNENTPFVSHLQIIVVDGGSKDNTCEIAHGAGAQLLEAVHGATRNRGAQLKCGAAVATGDALWFLHADARPHPQSIAAIHRALINPRTSGGNFRLKFDSHLPIARAFERIARLQRLRGVFYGDSGLFIRRSIYCELGGFRPWPLFEDYDLIRRVERRAQARGEHTVCLPYPLIASARRFEKNPLHTLGQWALFQVLFSAGISPQRLAAFYHR